MSTLDKKYVLKVDTKSTFLNPTPQFSLSDNETSDFNIRISNANKIIDLKDIIIVMVAIDPNDITHSDFVEVERANEGLAYCNLSQSLKNIDGTWKARLMCIYGQERIVTSTFSYKVNTDEFVQLDKEIIEDDRFGTLTEMLSRLSSIENSELSRQKAELSREEAEKLRQEAIEKAKTDIAKLISDTNSKVTDNLQENTAKTDKLVTDTNKKIDDYKLEKDTAIQQDLEEYKSTTTQDINTYKNDKNLEIDNYKKLKDTEINKNLSDYKTNTTADIETYKNNKNAEINQYKTEKDLEIDTYVANKNKELDRYVAAKNDDIDNYKKYKDELINDKLKEVDTAEQKRAAAEQQRVTDHAERETFLNSFESQLGQIGTKNAEQDARIDKVEYKNKVQDVYINGLFNENADGRLSITGEGNSVKLEGSKQGLVEVGKVVGNTLVNLSDIVVSNTDTVLNSYYKELSVANCNMFKSDTVYSLIYTLNIKNDTSNGAYNSMNIGLGDSTAILELMPGSGSIVVKNGINIIPFTFNNPNNRQKINIRPVRRNTPSVEGESITYSIENLIILEGDYTNKPIPSESFEGMQSTFEDKLITQEQIDAGEEKAENLGKYKVDVKVKGKNLFDIDKLVANDSDVTKISNSVISFKHKVIDIGKLFNLDNTKSYVLSGIFSQNADSLGNALWGVKNSDGILDYHDKNVVVSEGWQQITITFSNHGTSTLTNPQIEIGTVATQYEPYFERVQNVYLNSPALKGDVIESREDGVYHVNNRERELFVGNEAWTLVATKENTMVFGLSVSMTDANSLCNRMSVNTNIVADNEFYYYGTEYYGSRQLIINIAKSKLTSLDLIGFKALLKKWNDEGNPLTIEHLKELTEEKVSNNKLLLECIGGSSVHFETNVPILSSSFSYTGNVPSVIAMNNNLKNVNNEQLMQNEIDNTTMLAVADVYEMLMPVATMSLTKEGGNKMVELYVVLIMRGLKTIEQVPVAIRSQVEEMLKQVQ